jgi:TniQ
VPTSRPLPRSLDPLSDESLPGYLLRLAHRLSITPARLANLTGLTSENRQGSRVPAGVLVHLPTTARDTFAAATRLTPGEVDRLCLGSMSRRYPLHPPLRDGRRAAHVIRPDHRVFAPTTRYCPHCLAGNGSAIQRAHAGPWRKSWHLPIVFACVEHQRLLQHLCPTCRQPAHATRAGSSGPLLPHMRVATLHPAQCRAQTNPGNGRRLPACCGARLDFPTTQPPVPAAEALLDLQRRIVDLLHDDGPDLVTSAGQPTQPARYFTDLRVLTLLVNLSWPACRHMAPSPTLAEAIDRHIDQQHHSIAAMKARSATSRPGRLCDTPPADAAAGAGLIAIADQILKLADPDEVREHLRPLLPASTRQARRSSWGNLVFRSSTDWSDGLREACQPLLQSFTRVDGRPHARREASLRPARLGPEHIPAFLPNDWYERRFRHLQGVNPKIARRTVAVRLVQMLAGGSMGQAAQFLGINPTGKQYTSSEHVHRWARNQPDPRGFEAALRALAAELDASPHRVDYRQRRTALQDWCLDPTAWQELTTRLPPTPGPVQPELGDRKRQIASIYVWVRLTRGEHLFAPRPIEAQQPPHIQRAWMLRRNTIWHHFPDQPTSTPLCRPPPCPRRVRRPTRRPHRLRSQTPQLSRSRPAAVERNPRPNSQFRQVALRTSANYR